MSRHPNQRDVRQGGADNPVALDSSSSSEENLYDPARPLEFPVLPVVYPSPPESVNSQPEPSSPQVADVEVPMFGDHAIILSELLLSQGYHSDIFQATLMQFNYARLIFDDLTLFEVVDGDLVTVPRNPADRVEEEKKAPNSVFEVRRARRGRGRPRGSGRSRSPRRREDPVEAEAMAMIAPPRPVPQPDVDQDVPLPDLRWVERHPGVPSGTSMIPLRGLAVTDVPQPPMDDRDCPIPDDVCPACDLGSEKPHPPFSCILNTEMTRGERALVIRSNILPCPRCNRGYILPGCYQCSRCVQGPAVDRVCVNCGHQLPDNWVGPCPICDMQTNYINGGLLPRARQTSAHACLGCGTRITEMDALGFVYCTECFGTSHMPTSQFFAAPPPAPMPPVKTCSKCGFYYRGEKCGDCSDPDDSDEDAEYAVCDICGCRYWMVFEVCPDCVQMAQDQFEEEVPEACENCGTRFYHFLGTCPECGRIV